MFQQIMSKQCSECGKPMKLIKGNYGEFYGCTGYPTCKNTAQLSDAPPKPQKGTYNESEGQNPSVLLLEEIQALRGEFNERMDSLAQFLTSKFK